MSMPQTNQHSADIHPRFISRRRTGKATQTTSVFLIQLIKSHADLNVVSPTIGRWNIWAVEVDDAGNFQLSNPRIREAHLTIDPDATIKAIDSVPAGFRRAYEAFNKISAETVIKAFESWCSDEDEDNESIQY